MFTDKDRLIMKESPICPLAAEVVQDDQSAYFYLYKVNKKTKECVETLAGCWIKNLVKAPEDFDIESMKKGIPPAMPYSFCKNPDDLEPLNKDDLEIVWSQEGNIAGLYCKDELISVIPSWANPNKFCGYTKNCVGKSPIGWQLGTAEENKIFERMEKGKEFWSQNIPSLWAEYQQNLINDLNNVYGEQKLYYAIDGGNFPPRGLSIHQKDNICYVCTIGVGFFSMPNVELYYNDYENYNKSEIIFAFESDKFNDEQKSRIYMQMSVICNMIWNNMTFISHGDTVDFKAYEDKPCAVFINDMYYKTQSGFLCQKEGVNLLWLIPIDTETLKFGQEVGNNNRIINKTIKEDKRY